MNAAAVILEAETLPIELDETPESRLRSLIDRIAEDARSKPERYLEDTIVPEGGE